MGKPEAYVENYLRDKGKEYGFLCWKFVSPAHAGVPDRVIIGHGKIMFVETKAPGQKARPLQLAVHKQMREYGADVRVIDTREGVDALYEELLADE